ncbi:MAG: molybdopterin molybdotransferase MoeA [Eggerthellaceae bacterium]|nr:molybdopterin molybdotransferase MoeA [Eggerthellaceae bacterium]
MRDHSKHVQVSKEQAIDLILGACRFSPDFEEVPIGQAIGRVLAHDAVARLDMPNALTCCMDSIAVHWDDFAELDGGLPNTTDWVRGRDWEFANTGVAMPEGFDTAIVVEHVRVSADEQHVELEAAPSKRFAGTRPAGSKFHEGDVLVEAGTTITPLLAAHIASGNNSVVEVIAKPKVAFLPTGNELVPVGGEIPLGRNIETNSLLMKGKIEQWGGQALLYPITPDDPEALEAALRKASAEADIVVLNAGSSKGSDDWSLEILERIGKVLYHQTSHGPGHHSSCSVLDNTPVIGISGPPGGAAFTADLYLCPAMRKFLGQDPQPARVLTRLANAFPSGGPGGAAGQTGASSKPAGEVRPSETGLFYGIKQMVLHQADDGFIEACPASSSHPGPVEAEAADAYYALKTGPGIQPPAVGDLVEVVLRPER